MNAIVGRPGLALFWRHAFAFRGSVTPKVLSRVVIFGFFAALVSYIHQRNSEIAVAIGPLEVSGAVLGVLLVLRINSGYDRWWEARKLWGGIVNQSRNLVISALAYGPADQRWRDRIARLAASFAYVARSSLRGEREVPELKPLLEEAEADAITSAQHMPTRVAYLLARELGQARQNGGLDGFAYLQIDKERALLIEHIGASERIRNSPIPYVCAIKVRRFIVLYLLILPFALAAKAEWLTPLVEMFVAYPLLALDQIGEELQNPFAKENLSHLPLDEIASTIQGNVLGRENFDEPPRSKLGIAR